MRAIPYRVTLQEPLLAKRIAGDPNSGVSSPYVPGSVVRGAAVSAYRQAQALRTLDAGDAEIQRLFFDGQTRYLNAYAVDGEGVRALPTPRSLFYAKGQESWLYDFALETVHKVDEETVQFVAAAKESQLFCRIEGDLIEFVSPQRRVNVHTQRDRMKGRAVTDAGAVFQYDALEEGQTFAGWVLVDTDADTEPLTALLRTIRHIGGSSNSGYGRVSVDVGAAIDSSQKVWSETSVSYDVLNPGDTLVVTLLSDLLIRAPESGNYTWDIRPALQKALGAAIESVQEIGEAAQCSVWRMEEVGGFNRTWGLPLPQAQAIAAGSVFVFRVQELLSRQSLAAAQWRGLGERRAEGFGRLAFGWQQAPTLKVSCRSEDSKRKTADVQFSEGAAKTLAMQMAVRMLRQELAHKLRKTVYDLRIEGKPAISNAQLSRLRVIVRAVLPEGDLERLQRYLRDNIKTRRVVRDQFERTHFDTGLGRKRLLHWLEELLEDPETVWNKIGAQNASKRIGANLEVAARGNQALAREYTLRLVDGVLARVAKERRKEDGGSR
ncbi:MAG: type III-D CRISPR-associated RAMP protein Csx10 [Caldilinea sp.]